MMGAKKSLRILLMGGVGGKLAPQPIVCRTKRSLVCMWPFSAFGSETHRLQAVLFGKCV